MKEDSFFCKAVQAMLRHFRPIAVLFAALMLAVAGCVGWYTVRAVGIRADIADQAYQVEYNEGRVRRQLYEKQQAEAEIPGLEKQLEEIRGKASKTADEKAAQRAAAPSMFRGTFRGISAAKKDAKARLEEAETSEGLAREELNALLESLTGGEQP